jgi:hypothetical protein
VQDFVRLAQVVCAGSQSVVTFSSIPATYTDLYLTYSMRATGATGVVGLNVKFNSDGTAGNYIAGQYAFGRGSTVSGSSVAGATTGQEFAELAGTSVATHPLTTGHLLIPNYSGSTLEKGFTSVYLMNWQASNVSDIRTQGGQWIATPAAINRMDLTITGGSILNGSTFTLYGLR